MREYFVWLAKFVTIVFFLFIVIPFFMAVTLAATSQFLAELPKDDKNLVSVIEVNGTILDSKDILSDLYDQIEDKRVKGVVLRINSPGGAVGPSQDIYSAVKKLKERKPIVASMGALAASGGLYSALSASKVFCQPGTLTGSIGVIMQIPNLTKIANMVGFEMITIKSGELKDAGNTFRPMTDTDRAFLQATISEAYGSFVDAVVEGRKLPRDQVLKFADGRVILGSQAKDLKLVDDYGDVYDAARAVFDLLGEPLSKDVSPKLFYPGDKFGQFKKLVEGASSTLKIFSRQPELQYLMY